VTLDQTMASLAGLSAAGETGSLAGSKFLEVIGQLNKKGKDLGIQIFRNANGHGIDFIRTLEGIKAKYGDISRDPRLAGMFEKALGLRAGPALTLMLNNLDKIRQAQAGVTNSTGATDK